MTFYHITYGWMHAWSIGLLLTDDNRNFPQFLLYTHIFLLFGASKRKPARIVTHPIYPLAIHVQVSMFSFLICPIRGRLDTF